MPRLESSSIEFADYDAERGTLYITFHNGSKYAYFDVPADIYRALLDAQPQPGRRVFLPLIRDNYAYGRVQ